MIKFTITVEHLDLEPMADRIIPRLTGSESHLVNSAARKVLLSMTEEKQEELLIRMLNSENVHADEELQKLLDKNGIKADISSVGAERI